MPEELFLLHEKLSRVSQQFPQRIAIEVKYPQGYQKYTYEEIYGHSRAVGAWLIKEGLKNFDKIAIILENCPQWSICYFGIMYAGLVAVPIDPQLTQDEIANLLLDCRPEVIFTSKKFIPLFSALLNQLPFIKRIIISNLKESTGNFISLTKLLLTQVPQEEGFWPTSNLEAIASILYTSGTVGKPKGVMLTHQNFSSEFNSIKKIKLCNSEDNFICILPLYHAYSFMVTLLVPLFYGAKISYPASLKSEDILSCMRDTGVSMLVGVPELFFNLYKAILEKIKHLPVIFRFPLGILLNLFYFLRKISGINLSKVFLNKIHASFGKRLRFFISGGAHLDPKVALGLERLGFRILEGYGLTETSPVVAFNPPRSPRIGSVGKALPDVKINIIHPDAQGIGEIAIRGLNLMKGYFKDETQTKEVIKEGWFYSGDLGFLDSQGYLYITGRSKEVIVLSSGKNIYPEEIESYYLMSKFIKEICVLEIKDPDTAIETLQAVILPNFEYFSQVGEVSIAAKIKWDLENLSKNITSYKRIMGFILTKENLPRTRLGKIKRYEVRRQYLDKLLKKEISEEKYAPPAADLEIIQSELGQKIIQHIRRNISLKRELRLDDHLELDLGIDSLSRVELIVGLEKILDISIPDALVAECSTIRKLILKIEEQLLFQKGRISDIRSPLWGQIIKMPPQKEIIKNIELSPNPATKIVTFIFSNSFRAVLTIFCQLKIINQENVPLSGPYIFCVNHSSYLDGFVIESAVSFKVRLNLFFIGAREIFRHPSLAWTLKVARLVPIDPAKELISAMQACSFLLKHGKILCIFPEGQRSIDGQIGEFKKGIGILVKELDVPIVPVAIFGTHKAWGRAVSLPKPYPVKIIFGKPLRKKELLEMGLKAGIKNEYEAITFALRKEVLRLYSLLEEQK